MVAMLTKVKIDSSDMDRIPIPDVIEALARSRPEAGLLWPNGTVNYTKFGLFVGLPPPTVMRLYKQVGKQGMQEATATKIARAFDVTESQVRGIEPLDSAKVTTAEAEFLRKLLQMKSEKSASK